MKQSMSAALQRRHIASAALRRGQCQIAGRLGSASAQCRRFIPVRDGDPLVGRVEPLFEVLVGHDCAGRVMSDADDLHAASGTLQPRDRDRRVRPEFRRPDGPRTYRRFRTRNAGASAGGTADIRRSLPARVSSSPPGGCASYCAEFSILDLPRVSPFSHEHALAFLFAPQVAQRPLQSSLHRKPIGSMAEHELLREIRDVEPVPVMTLLSPNGSSSRSSAADRAARRRRRERRVRRLPSTNRTRRRPARRRFLR